MSEENKTKDLTNEEVGEATNPTPLTDEEVEEVTGGIIAPIQDSAFPPKAMTDKNAPVLPTVGMQFNAVPEAPQPTKSMLTNRP